MRGADGEARQLANPGSLPGVRRAVVVLHLGKPVRRRQATPHGAYPRRATGEAMRGNDRTKLLFGPTGARPLKRGDRATCLSKDCDVQITIWTGARIQLARGVGYRAG